MEMDRCHFWLARFRDQQQIDEYFREEYGDDDKPISLFAADQGQTFYDHDRVFVEASDTGNLRDLLRKVQVPEATGKIVQEFAQRLGRESNALVVADEGEFENPVSVENASYWLVYVGCYRLWG